MNDWMQKLKMRLPVMVLLAATFLFWGSYDPCKPDGPVLLDSPALADAAVAEGDCSEVNSVFTLRRPASGIKPVVRFVLSGIAGCETIRLSGRIRAENVVRGRYHSSCARLVLVQRDIEGKWVAGTESRMYGAGSFGWTEFLNDYLILPSTVSAEVVLLQSGESGTAQFDSIAAYPVKARAAGPWKMAFAAAWGIMGVVYFRRCRLHTRRLGHLILLNALVILVGVLMPNTWLQQAPGRIHSIMDQFSCAHGSEAPELQKHLVTAGLDIDLVDHVVGTVNRSVGHFLLFGSLSFLVLLSVALERLHPFHYLAVAFDMLLFGGVTEALQYLTPDRTVDVVDLLCNAYGMLAAMVLFSVVRVCWRWCARNRVA
ncbi:hypothetical protein SCARR_03220 [Pontiella sulfatireligans]|uniref:VanZ-like domain-containing protein n=2 Tax=Pontiella sulfatireligans TaxID=2750658 RepID=A0A6C2UMC4_9BACT|nr:hypothetical protein SCARR_03220 [Pontiella sulfatireligans]